MGDMVPTTAGRQQRHTRRIRTTDLAFALLIMLGMPFGSIAAMMPTPAGTVIRNIGELAYGAEGTARRIASNEDRLIVAERLDIRLAAAEATPPRRADGIVQVAFTVVNAGTGTESFRLSIDGAAAGLTPDHVLHGERRLIDGDTGPIAAGEAITLVAVLAGAGPEATAGTITIDARAITGAGETGTTFEGRGDGGGDAVVGPTGAASTLTIPIDATTADATFEKSQKVTAPDGSARPVAGATVTYRLVARFGTSVRGARIDDPIPTGTRYAPGSLVIDDARATDAADADAGACDGRRVTVALGDLPPAAVRTVQFRVIIQ